MFDDSKNVVMLFNKEHEVLYSRPCHHGMPHPQVMEGGNSLQAAVYILNK
jgi:hypothetical protein